MADEVRVGDRIAQTADALSRAFATELARVLRDAERALRPVLRQALAGDRTAQVIATRGVALRRQLRTILTTAGYDGLVEASTTTAVARMSDAVLGTRIGRAGVGLIRPNPDAIAALARLGEANLLSVGDDVAGALWRSVVQYLWTVRPAEDILADLSDVFAEEVSGLETLFDTQVSIFGRQVEALATADAPPDQAFLFLGPVDGLTRPWCLAHVGRVYTRAAIEALDNGQLPNPFLTGGGYNCRHSFLAVQAEAWAGLVNTGTVIPELRDDVARAEARAA